MADGLVRLHGTQREQGTLLQRHGHGRPREQHGQRPQHAYLVRESGLLGLRHGSGLGLRDDGTLVPDDLGHTGQGLVPWILHLVTLNMTDGSYTDLGPSGHFVSFQIG
ncbi:hypothetical protein [Streptomyces sp. NBC_00829]|uniref:hypothetical protein n=1 Tax=Streptomyces sp. NBC_00829 TaxID=2903679 RepID=UPI00386C5407|nr:hypothetical protein OG293_25805 [Streptomyces sp. NBC_00829]